jgi:integrase
VLASRTEQPSAKHIRSDLEAAGCPKEYAGHEIDFHACRRSFATWLAEADVPDPIIKRLMGHRAAGVTEKHHTARTLTKLKDAVEKIELDLSMADDVVSLPIRAVGDPTQK